MARQRNVGKQPHSGTYVRAWPCACGKRGYKRREDAKTVVREIRRAGSTRSGHLEAYQCLTDPDYWHVGHRPATDNAPNLNDPGTWTDE